MTTTPAGPAGTTLGELSAPGWRSRSVKEELRANLRARIGARASLLPGILGCDEAALPQLEKATLAGRNVILLGRRGRTPASTP